MSVTKEMRSKLELWKHYFLEVGSSINDYQEKLNQYSSTKKSKKDTNTPDYFRTAFLVKQKSVQDILDDLEKSDAQLSAKDPDAPVSDEMEATLKSLLETMDQFQHQYNALKIEFYQKLKLP